MWRKISKIYFFLSVFAFLVFYNSISSAESGVILDELLTEVQKTLIRVRDTIEEEDLPPLNKEGRSKTEKRVGYKSGR
jgi:hypothetical protein